MSTTGFARINRDAVTASRAAAGDISVGVPGLGDRHAHVTVMTANLPRRLAAEALGTAMLLAAVVGSGIMADRLSGGTPRLR